MEIKDVLAKNLVELRKLSKITQAELANELNYSDKSVSKWEHGDALPDIEVLSKLAFFYGVTVDYLISEHKEIAIPEKIRERRLRGNRLIISLLAVSAVWIISTILYVQLIILNGTNWWQVFVWSVPASATVFLIFYLIWGKGRFIFPLISVLMWTLITSIYLELLKYNLWVLYFIGVPLQVAIILWSRIKKQS